MTRVEITQKLIEAKELLTKDAKSIANEFTIARSEKMFEVIQKYFGGELILDDVYVDRNSYGSYYEVKRPHPDHSYDKEIMTLRLKEDWKTDLVTTVETSVYSTSENSTWELERLFIVGKIAQILLDFQDDIIAEFNTVIEDFSVSIKEANETLWTLERDLKDLQKSKLILEKETRLNQLESVGIDFQKPVNLDVKWDWTVRNIKRAKITEKTLSGKSASLELVTDSGVVNVKNVRIDKIESILF
jgi:hypothetical protein